MAQAKQVVPVHGDAHLREKNDELLKENGFKTINAENGQVLQLKGGKAKIVKDMTTEPHYIGFEKRQANHWTDRDYIVHTTVNYRHADNDNDVEPPSQKDRRRPRLFHHKPK